MLNLDYLLGKDILTPPQEREFRRLFSYSFHRLENNAGIAIKYIYKKNPQQKEMTLLLNKNQSLTASKNQIYKKILFSITLNYARNLTRANHCEDLINLFKDDPLYHKRSESFDFMIFHGLPAIPFPKIEEVTLKTLYKAFNYLRLK